MKSDYAAGGLYVYDNSVFEIIRTLKPSGRSELEITDVNNEYIRKRRMKYSVVEGHWSDAGRLVVCSQGRWYKKRL